MTTQSINLQTHLGKIAHGTSSNEQQALESALATPALKMIIHEALGKNYSRIGKSESYACWFHDSGSGPCTDTWHSDHSDYSDYSDHSDYRD